MMRTIYLDIETADAGELYTYGSEFCRLAGYAVNADPVRLTTDMRELTDEIRRADRVVAHNAIGFDLAALARWHDLDVGKLVDAGLVRDTLILARHNDPPLSGHIDDGRYGLDALGLRFTGVGKESSASGSSTLQILASKFGGYDRIPVDDADYRRYLVRDVELLRAVAGHLNCDAYALREHRVLWRLGGISRAGFRVDVDEARRRISAQHARITTLKSKLHAFGLPEVGKAPQRTKEGIRALEIAFAEFGIDAPRTAKGSLATGRDALTRLLELHPKNLRLQDLVETLRALNGERSVVQSLIDHTSDEGRVHPSVDARQSTGRISVTRPGLTVMGKRDRANVLERSLLLPDRGDVLIAFDLSQVDARAIAAHCQDPGYIAAFAAGKDYHTEMAVELFGDPQRRSDAKPVTHATTYGMGARGLAASAGIGQADAQALLNKLDSRFPKLAVFKREVRAEAKHSQLLWNAFGRPMRIEEGREYTQAPAAIGQGTARDLMMEGILRLPTWLLSCLRAIVHDEIVLSVPTDRADEAEASVLKALQFSFRPPSADLAVQVLAEKSDRGRDWCDCYRSEKPYWSEVARDHREQPGCDDPLCTWHAPLVKAA
ncbi:MAG TPA: DNA polymerase [Plantibacter sp.]|uniref:DNA polymerase n=1 Tax=unclassified Plantibacter TaxID=2624265 RepID=UPI002C067C44|nr:DNA polymerase [Plantibacter sp.]